MAHFRGDAREALEFYQSVFGGDLSIATYADIYAVEDPAQTEQVAFGRVAAPNGFDIMAYDVQPSKSYNPGENAFYVTLQSTDADEIKLLWDALGDGAAAILIPLAPAAFAPLYGMLTDRFDVIRIVGVRHSGKQLIVRPTFGITGAGPVRDKAYRCGTLFDSQRRARDEFVVTAREAVSCPARSCMTPSEPPTR